MNGRKNSLSDYVELLKLNLCVYVGLSAVFGYVMASRKIGLACLAPGVSVFILACGSAVLNNIQDKEYDKHFTRTSARVLPMEKLPVSHAVCLSILLVFSGLAGLWSFCGFRAFMTGCLAVLCYNGLYTPLKKHTLLAIIPGSITGMLGPLIGWTSIPQTWMSKEIWLIMGIFGLWQIPHSLIVLLRKKRISESKGSQKDFPCFTRLFSTQEIQVQILIWASLYSLAIGLFLLEGPITSQNLSMLTGLNSIALLSALVFLLTGRRKTNPVFAFAAINLSMLFFMAAGISDKFLM